MSTWDTNDISKEDNADRRKVNHHVVFTMKNMSKKQRDFMKYHYSKKMTVNNWYKCFRFGFQVNTCVFLLENLYHNT